MKKTFYKQLLCCAVMALALTGAAMAAESSQLTVTVPTSLPVNIDTEGHATVSDSAAIVNKSSFGIAVSIVQVEPNNGWKLVEYNHNFHNDKVGKRNFAMRVNNENIGSDGMLAPADWVIPGNGQSTIQYDYKLSAQMIPRNNATTARVMFRFEWDGLYQVIWRMPEGDEISWMETPSADAYPGAAPVNTDDTLVFAGWTEVSRDEEAKTVIYEPIWEAPEAEWQTMPTPATLTLNVPDAMVQSGEAGLSCYVTATLSDIRELGRLQSLEEFASFFPDDLDVSKCEYLTPAVRTAISEIDGSTRSSYKSQAMSHLDLTNSNPFVWTIDDGAQPVSNSKMAARESTAEGNLTLEEILEQLAGGGSGNSGGSTGPVANENIKIEVNSYTVANAKEDRPPSVSCDVVITWVGDSAGEQPYTVSLKDGSLTVSGIVRRQEEPSAVSDMGEEGPSLESPAETTQTAAPEPTAEKQPDTDGPDLVVEEPVGDTEDGELIAEPTDELSSSSQTDVALTPDPSESPELPEEELPAVEGKIEIDP